MTQTASFPYETRLNILHGPLEVMDVHAVPGANDFKWFNQTLCRVNGSVVRMAAIEGEYHWHKHDDDDEFFYVVDGELLIDIDGSAEGIEGSAQGVDGSARRLEGRTVALGPGQGFVVPKTVVHRTRAPRRTTILMVENAGIIPTGN
jgi:mannose-6-phosphate isomerase-like protein (cupin superfamily)